MSAERNFTDQEYELLSAYLDDALTQVEHADLEARLMIDDDLRAELEAVRETVGLVRGLATIHAPRDFRLTATMVHPSRWLIFPTTTAFSAIAAAAAMLLIFFGATLLFGQNIGTANPTFVAALQQNAESQIAANPTIMGTPQVAQEQMTALNDLFYAATASVNAQTGVDDNSSLGGSGAQDEAVQETAPFTLLAEGTPSDSPSEEGEQAQFAVPSAGIVQLGTQAAEPPAAPETSGYTETDALEAPTDGFGQAGNAPSAAMADEAAIAATDTAGFERASLTPTLMVTPTNIPSPTATIAVTPTATPAPTSTPIPVRTVEQVSDLFAPILLALGVLLLAVAIVTTVIRWRRR